MFFNRSIAHRISLAVVIVLLAACRSRTSLTHSPSPVSITSISISTLVLPSTPTPIVLENGWYLYRDPDGEFSFTYPPTALISAGQNPVDLSKNITIQFLLPEMPYQGMSIRIEPNPKRLQGAAIAQQLFEKSGQKPATVEFTNSLQTILVGGISAVKTTIPSSNTEVTIIVPYDVKVLIVSPVHDTQMTKVEKETLDLFYQILNTMKFGISQ
jgi:hypothetical protein